MPRKTPVIPALLIMTLGWTPAFTQIVPDIGDWKNIGFSGGGAMFAPAISPLDRNLIMINCNMSNAFISYDGAVSWNMIHHLQLKGNTLCKPGFHPGDVNIIFAANGWDGRLHISRDRGKTWQEIGNIDQGRLEGEIAIHPDDANLMLTGSRGQVWRSQDGGNTWSRVNGPNGTVLGFHFDRTGAQGSICFAATENGIWRSQDGGITWTGKSNGLPSGSLLGFAGGSNNNSIILYCTVDNRQGLYRSTDRGDTWTSLTVSSVEAQYHMLLANDVEPSTVYVFTDHRPSTMSLDHSAVFRSDDSGETWRPILYPHPIHEKFNLEYNYHTAYLNSNGATIPHDAAIDPNNPDFILFLDLMQCLFTKDGGNTWKNGHIHAVPEAGETKPETFLNNGLMVTSTWHYYIDPFEPNRHYIAYTDIGFTRSLDAGKSWLFWPYWGMDRTIPWFNTCYELAFDPDTPGKMWGAFSQLHDIPNGNVITGDHYLTEPERTGGIAFSQDFAATWEQSNQGLPDAPAVSVVLDPESAQGSRTLYAAIYEHGVYKSTDDGSTWTKNSNGLGSPANMRVCRVSLHRDGTLFCLVTAMYLHDEDRFISDGVGLYRSRDAGENWELVNSSQQFLWPKDFTVHPDNSNEIYLGIYENWLINDQGGLWRTTDGGATWERIARKSSGRHFGAYLHPSRPGWIYMTLCEGVEEDALWLSRDNGISWEAFDRLPFSNIQRVEFDPGNENVIYVTTFGGSVYKMPSDPKLKLPVKGGSIIVEPQNAFDLRHTGNTVDFIFNTPGVKTLTIYDVFGRIVQRWPQIVAPRLHWDVSTVPAAIYFARSGDFSRKIEHGK
jgi:photosystem II stability/assembly factor-like uncharacterized protein